MPTYPSTHNPHLRRIVVPGVTITGGTWEINSDGHLTAEVEINPTHLNRWALFDDVELARLAWAISHDTWAIEGEGKTLHREMRDEIERRRTQSF